MRPPFGYNIKIYQITKHLWHTPNKKGFMFLLQIFMSKFRREVPEINKLNKRKTKII